MSVLIAQPRQQLTFANGNASGSAESELCRQNRCDSVLLHMGVSEPSPWRTLGMLATVGITFVVSTAGATVGGYFLDRWLGTSPWLTLIGMGVGIAAGFRDLFRSIKQAEKQERDGP